MQLLDGLEMATAMTQQTTWNAIMMVETAVVQTLIPNIAMNVNVKMEMALQTIHQQQHYPQFQQPHGMEFWKVILTNNQITKKSIYLE